MNIKKKFLVSVFLVVSIINLQIFPALALDLPPPPPPVEPPAPVPIPPPEPVPVPPVTPPADTTAPVISSVASLSLGINEATLVWTTDELAVSHIEYGTTTSYGTAPTLDATALLAHTAILTGLNVSTTYYYCIHATDLFGNAADSCGHSFVTAAESILVDTTPPDITIVTVAPITSTSATVNWTTSEVANAQIDYGTTAGYGSTTSLDTNLALTHAVTLSNLTPNTLYHCRIRTSDEIGNVTIGPDETFTTELVSANVSVGTPDTTPPVVSGVGSISLGLTDATLAWTTNELATSTLEYGTTTSYGTPVTLPTSLLLAHAATLTGLSAGTTYYYCIHATDLALNTTNSCPHSFTTAATPGEQTEATTVLISGVETTPITTSTATISWTTDLPADSQIEYGVSVDFGSLTVLSSALTTSHSVTLTGLTPNTNYIFRVKSKPIGGTVATISANYEFNTLSVSTPVVPAANILSVSSSDVTASGATIAWATDKAATSLVEYGISTSYGQSSALNSTMQMSHGIVLADLFPSTTYHFRVRSTDEVSNVTYSEDYTFVTPSTSGNSENQATPSAVTTLSIGGYDQNSAEVVWNVGSAGADVTQEYDIRYSATPITALNFESALQAQTTPIFYGDLSPNGTERAYIVAGLNQNTRYYFALKSKYENSTYGDLSNVVFATTTHGASVNINPNIQGNGSSASGGVSNIIPGASVATEYGAASGGSSTASFEPTLIRAEPADSQIIFSWHNPHETNFVRTVIVRKEGGYPSAPTDGAALYEGRAETFADTNVVNGKTYYYAVYAYNHSKTYSSAVRVSLAPKAGNYESVFNESGSIVHMLPIYHFTRVFKKGDKDIEIEHLQEILSVDNDSYPEKYITGYFGALTEAALKRFQTKHGLAVTGIVDVTTQSKLNTISKSEEKLEVPQDYALFDTDLKIGNQNETVRTLQSYLTYEGSLSGAYVTGYFGSYTKAAVMTFQKKYGITPVSGYVGVKTRHRMRKLTGL